MYHLELTPYKLNRVHRPAVVWTPHHHRSSTEDPSGISLSLVRDLLDEHFKGVLGGIEVRKDHHRHTFPKGVRAGRTVAGGILSPT